MAWKDSGIDENDTGSAEGDFWEPEKGDILQGQITEPPKKGQYGKFFLKVMDSQGDIWITSQHGHLDKQIKALNIVEGDTIKCEYLGLGPEPDDIEYSAPHLYRLQKWED